VRLSALLGRPVVDGDGRRWGTVHDARLVQDGPLLASGSAAFRLHGLVAGPGSLGTRLGYADRGGDEAKGPLPLRLAVRWLHRRAVYVPWGAVRSVEADRIVVEAPPGGFEPVRTPR
jgi:sporulation protein YlmC with PRC-barrel domain